MHTAPFRASQYYDVTGQGTNDYPVTDLLQMMGRASRPLHDEQGMCVGGEEGEQASAEGTRMSKQPCTSRICSPVLPPLPACSCVLMCHAPKKEYYKKFLFEPLPGACHVPAAVQAAC